MKKTSKNENLILETENETKQKSTRKTKKQKETSKNDGVNDDINGDTKKYDQDGDEDEDEDDGEINDVNDIGEIEVTNLEETEDDYSDDENKPKKSKEEIQIPKVEKIEEVEKFGKDIDHIKYMKQYLEYLPILEESEYKLKDIYNLPENENLESFFARNPLLLSKIPDNVDKKEFKKVVKDYLTASHFVKESKEKMIEKLEYLVYYIINKNFSTFKKYTKELYQEGILGILASMKKYDYEKSSPSTYFFNYILHQMNDFVNFQINKTSPHYATHITKIKKAINSLEKEGKEVTVIGVAQITKFSAETIVQSMKIMELSNEMHYETIDVLESNLSETFQSPEEEFVKNEIVEIIRSAVNELPEDEKNVINLKFGLLDGVQLSYKSISETLGIQIDRVKKLNASAIRKLKKNKLILDNFGNMKKSNKVLNQSLVGIIPIEAGEKLFDEICESFAEEEEENQNESNE